MFNETEKENSSDDQRRTKSPSVDITSAQIANKESDEKPSKDPRDKFQDDYEIGEHSKLVDDAEDQGSFPFKEVGVQAKEDDDIPSVQGMEEQSSAQTKKKTSKGGSVKKSKKTGKLLPARLVTGMEYLP